MSLQPRRANNLVAHAHPVKRATLHHGALQLILRHIHRTLFRSHRGPWRQHHFDPRLYNFTTDTQSPISIGPIYLAVWHTHEL